MVERSTTPFVEAHREGPRGPGQECGQGKGLEVQNDIESLLPEAPGEANQPRAGWPSPDHVDPVVAQKQIGNRIGGQEMETGIRPRFP